MRSRWQCGKPEPQTGPGTKSLPLLVVSRTARGFAASSGPNRKVASGHVPLALIVEVVTLFEVGEERGLHRMPVESLLGQRARRRDIKGEEDPEPAEMTGCLVDGNSGHGQFQMTADDFGDVADRNALLGNRVQDCAGGCLFQRQPE